MFFQLRNKGAGKAFYQLLRLGMLLGIWSCEGDNNVQQPSGQWIETIATLYVEKPEKEGYEVTIEYDIPKSTAVNSQGEKIMGPIRQYGIYEQEPVHEQKVKIRYHQDDPIFFEYIDSVKFVKK